jgi:hypothetical protein
MKYVLRAIFVLAFATLAATGGSVKSDAASRTVYDGDWDVDIITVRGDCQHSLRYSVRIAEGKVQSSVVTYQLDGTVNPAGEIHVTVEEKGRSASGTGKLTHNAGQGLWHTSTNECGGHWKAERRS